MSSRTRNLLGISLGLALVVGLGGCGGSEGGELVVTNIDPRAGATSGEQPVTIKGNNFRQDIGYTVYFGNKSATRATILDSNTLVVATPTMTGTDLPAGGKVDVVIAADNGPAYKIVDGFTFEDMSGNVMERVGETAGPQGQERF